MTKEIVRQSFIFKRHWWEVIKTIDNEDDKLFIFEFIFSYVFEGKKLEIPNHLQKGLKGVCTMFLRELETSLNDEETLVYVVKLKNLTEEFYKIGISKNEKNRLSSYKNLGFDTCLVESLTKTFPTRQQALDFERECHISLSDYSYVPIINFAGKTECFKMEAIEFIKNFFIEN